MRLLEEIVKDVLNKLSLEKKTSLQKRIERYIKRYNKLDEVKVEKEDTPGKKGPIKGR
jgi:ribosomal protein S15P/S13E